MHNFGGGFAVVLWGNNRVSEKLRVNLADGSAWVVHAGDVSDGIVGLTAFPEAGDRPPEPNVYWAKPVRNFDEIPDDLPVAVRMAIYRWMKATP